MIYLKDNILVKIFITFFKVGLFTIGGGLAMIPVIRDEFSVKNNYISEEEMMDLISITQTTPGVMAANIAAFVGYRLNKFKGAVIALLGAILPSFIIILIIALFYNNFMDNVYIGKAFVAVRAAIAAAIVVAGIEMAKKTINSYFSIFIAIISGIIVYFFSWAIIYVIIGGAILGIVYYCFKFKDKPSI